MAVLIPLTTSSDAHLEVSEHVFGCEFNQSLVHQLVVKYLATGRAGTKSQKTRAEVSGGGIKPWRQKGTGRARAGTTRSPLWRTGGVTFAAKSRDYGQKLNKKMYRSALKSIFSELLRQGRLIAFDQISPSEAKSKVLRRQLDELGFTKGLIVTEQVDRNLDLAARNLEGVAICNLAGMNPVLLVNSEKVFISSEAARKLEDILL